jgi:Xaa-Pro aminopeptidase
VRPDPFVGNLPKYPGFPEKEFRDRISRAKKILRRYDLGAFLLTEWENVHYFSAFNNSAFATTKDFPYVLIVTRDGRTTFVLREVMLASAKETSWIDDLRTYKQVSESKDVVKKTIADLGLRGEKIGVELGETMAVKFSTGLFLEMMRQSGADFVDGAQALWKLRMVKSPFEIERIDRASKIASRACERGFQKLKAGMTERDFSILVGRYMMEEGADAAAWPVTIQSGQKFKDGLMGGFADDTKLRKGEVVQIDWGAKYRQYESDLNRMAIIGRQPTSEEKDLWNVYVEANKRGISAIKPGIRASDVFRAIARVFEEAGLKNTNVRAGHGLGLEGHEPPNLGLHDDTKLEANMVFAVEPFGVPNRNGLILNCEDDAVCTEMGSRRLSTISREIYVA